MMELLNNIWNVLITPSELNTKLFILPFNFIEMYLFMTLFLTIFNISSNRKKRIYFVVITSLVIILTNFTIPNPFNVFINYILFFILILLIFKTTILKALISVVSSVAIFALIGGLILNPYITILNITTTQLSNTPIYKIVNLLIMYFVVFLIIIMLKNLNFKILLSEDIDKKTKKIIFLNLIFGIITLIVQAFITFYYIDKLPIIITFLSFISLLAYFSISIYSLTRVMKLSITTKKLESVEEYNKTLHILHDSVRGFKHDFDNIITTIGGYIKTNDIEGLEKYYAELVDDCQKVNTLYILNPEMINNPGIYNLLTNKYYEAESKGIKVNM